jgi:hypothetical protein
VRLGGRRYYATHKLRRWQVWRIFRSDACYYFWSVLMHQTTLVVDISQD